MNDPHDIWHNERRVCGCYQLIYRGNILFSSYALGLHALPGLPSVGAIFEC